MGGMYNQQDRSVTWHVPSWALLGARLDRGYILISNKSEGGHLADVMCGVIGPHHHTILATIEVRARVLQEDKG